MHIDRAITPTLLWHSSCKATHMPWLHPARLVTSATVPLLVSCQNPGASGGSERCDALYEDFSASEERTFVTDVLPVMQERCNLGPCHGGDGPDDAAGELWLGRGPDEAMSDKETDFVYRSLIDVESVAAPGLALVRPGKPEDSFFMLKLDDCQDFVGVDCVLDADEWGTSCGEVMPLLSDQLSATTLEVIRSWIASGAAYE